VVAVERGAGGVGGGRGGRSASGCGLIRSCRCRKRALQAPKEPYKRAVLKHPSEVPYERALLKSPAKES
jgi:hypothetical protein